jgi:hypothetical protein
MNSLLRASSASIGGAHAHHGPGSRAARLGHFVRHYFEMCLAMCVGFALLNPLFYGVARLIGISDPLGQIPELSALVVAFNMSVPMAAWMRHRGMEWGPISEMSGAMFVEAIVLIGVAWLGVFPRSAVVLWQHGLMMPAMLIPMLYRRNLYTAGHQAHAGESTSRPVRFAR